MSPRGYLMVALLTAMGVAGCAERHWAKPGATVEDFNRDSHACGLEAQRGVFSGLPVRTQPYRSCMRARGYQLVEGGPWVGLKD